MTFNILDGGTDRETLIGGVIAAANPDIILLQEVTEAKLVEDFAQTFRIHFAVAGGRTYRHVALLSRYPILSWQSHATFSRLSRNFLVATLAHKPESQIRIVVVHLTPQPHFLFEGWRVLEIRSLLRYAALEPDVPCLIGGDFNAVAPSDIVDRRSWSLRLKIMLALNGNHDFRTAIRTVQNAGFADCYRLLHKDDGFTLPASRPSVRLDYIFANRVLQQSLHVCYVVREPVSVNSASDHLPVVADFA